MGYCNKCKVSVLGKNKKCPLCQSELEVTRPGDFVNRFPDITTYKSRLDFVWRLFVIVSILALFVCCIVNYEVPDSGLWCGFVVGGVVTSWVFLFVVMKKYKNILKCLFYETIVVSGFVVIWDYCTGMHGWSLSFVLPILFMITIVAMGILAKIFRIGPEDHIVYFLSLATFGIIPSIFWLKGILFVELPSILCIGMSFVLIFTLVLFEGGKMLSELKKRFHI